jgi:DNA polymerase III epsilon subunit-like protein
MIDERLVFLDLETAGLETWRPIIQIAAIAVTSSLFELEFFEAKVQFDEGLAAPRALNKNHYSHQRWNREALPARKIAERFAEFLERHATIDVARPRRRTYQVAQLVAHNAAFDGAFLQAWYERLGMFLPGHLRMLCTMQRAVWLFHEDKSLTPPANYKLGTLCEYFDVRLRPQDAHDALADVRATVELYRAMTAWSQRRRAAA